MCVKRGPQNDFAIEINSNTDCMKMSSFEFFQLISGTVKNAKSY